MISAIEEAYYEYINKFLATQKLQKSKSVKFNSDDYTTLFSRKRSSSKTPASYMLQLGVSAKVIVSNNKVHRQHVTIFATMSPFFAITNWNRAQNQKKKKKLILKVGTGKLCLLLMKNSSTGIREQHKILIKA